MREDLVAVLLEIVDIVSRDARAKRFCATLNIGAELGADPRLKAVVVALGVRERADAARFRPTLEFEMAAANREQRSDFGATGGKILAQRDFAGEGGCCFLVGQLRGDATQRELAARMHFQYSALHGRGQEAAIAERR
jgi:hypothetical protein